VREKYDYWGVPFSVLYPIPNIRYKSVPHQIACDCGEKADSIKSVYRYQCKTCGRKYSLVRGDYILIKNELEE